MQLIALSRSGAEVPVCRRPSIAVSILFHVPLVSLFASRLVLQLVREMLHQLLYAFAIYTESRQSASVVLDAARQTDHQCSCRPYLLAACHTAPSVFAYG